MSGSELITKVTQLLKYDVSDLVVFLSPILYSFVWLVLLILAAGFLPLSVVGNEWFVIIYTIVFLFTTVAKATTWSIGHEKFGIKGDSRARVINYHGGQDRWFDLFADNPDLIKDKSIRNYTLRLAGKDPEEGGDES